MKKNAQAFLNKTLGSDFLESLGTTLQKSDIYKQGTRTVTDTNDLFQGLQIVPRALLSLLIRELSPMQIGDTKEVKIPGKEETIVITTKHERDSFSGQVIQNNVKISDFLHRSIPGLGLVLLSILELYNVDDLEDEPINDAGEELRIQKLIDERMHLHSLINQVVDGKLMHRDAVQQLIIGKLNQMGSEHKQILADKEEAPKPATVIVIEAKKKVRPLESFVESRKKKLAKKEFSVEIAKSETIDCPDCGHSIFNNSGISACICYGADHGKKVYLKKTETGIKLSFPKSWDKENISMLLEVLRRKNG